MSGDDRDRDVAGHPRQARPRDELGRPLPYGQPGVPPVAEDVRRTPAEALREAQHLLDSGLPFQAHEVLESVWKSCPEAERELWQGLAQLAVGVTHAQRGNAKGAATLVARGRARLAPMAGTTPYGIPVDDLLDWADRSTPVGLTSDPLRIVAPDRPAGG